MKSRKLSVKKRKFIEFLKKQKLDEKEAEKISKEIGISIKTYLKWLKDKEILNIAKKESAVEIQGHLPEVLNALVEKAKEGDMKAITIFLEKYNGSKDDKNGEEKLTTDKIIEIIRKAKKETKQKL